ncbi:hypothetical protein [Paraburkholderia acidipaludis]|uniref:hypothetical protein n=1 Tax=Paraburkholderia acidipaludis TaxID=660537 RepID=UPI00048924E4|nr:hypothetical protein [Paraburkholderia acidipaludis]
MSVFMNILTILGFVIGILCFLGINEKFNGWNKQRNIRRLEKQRSYYVGLAASEAERDHLVQSNLLVLMGLLFAYLMFVGIGEFEPNGKVLQNLIQTIVGIVGYMIACVVLGRLNRIRLLDKYLARVDKALANLRA